MLAVRADWMDDWILDASASMSSGVSGGMVRVVEDLPEYGPVVVGFGRVRLEELDVEFRGEQNG